MLCLDNSQFVHGNSAKKVCAFGEQQPQVVCECHRFTQTKALHRIAVRRVKRGDGLEPRLVSGGIRSLEADAFGDEPAVKLDREPRYGYGSVEFQRNPLWSALNRNFEKPAIRNCHLIRSLDQSTTKCRRIRREETVCHNFSHRGPIQSSL